MTKILKIFTLLSAWMLLFTACEKENPFPGSTDDATGSVNFRKMVVEVSSKETQVRSSSVDVASFVVDIISETGVTAYSGTYAALPEVVTLPVGNYTVSVKSPANPDADWDTPYYEGSQKFSIKENDVTYVDPVVCKLANVKVSVRFDAKLTSQMADDCTVTVETGTGATLQFAKNETRSGYFRYVAGEGSHTLVATFHGTVEGNIEENFRTYTDVAPGNHYIITYTLKTPSSGTPDNTGTVTPGLFVDASVEVEDMNINVDVEDETIPDTDRPQQGEPGPGPGPGPEPTGNPPTVVAMINGSTDYASPVEVTGEAISVTVKVDSEADSGLSAFTVEIVSTTLSDEVLGDVGLAKNLDLVNPGAFDAALTGIGFPTYVGGMKDVPLFDISTLVPLLKSLGAGDHKFILTVTDANGSTVKTLHFITK